MTGHLSERPISQFIRNISSGLGENSILKRHCSLDLLSIIIENCFVMFSFQFKWHCLYFFLVHLSDISIMCNVSLCKCHNTLTNCTLASQHQHLLHYRFACSFFLYTNNKWSCVFECYVFARSISCYISASSIY